MIICFRKMIVSVISLQHALYILFILKTLFLNGLIAKEKRFKAEPFPSWTIVLNHNISCGPHKAGLYPERTWSCTDIRVDGLPLVFGYDTGMANRKLCTDNNGTDNIGVVCSEMLKANGLYTNLWAATISDATCNKTTLDRMSLVQLDSSVYEWQKYDPGYGWIRTVHCTLVPEVHDSL